MVSTTAGVRIDEMALEVFEVLTHLGIVVPHGRRRPGDLKDIEYLTLAILQGRGTMIVGDIQRMLGVLPAQMSRIIRSLENRPQPMISCQINLRDKRKVDVGLTAPGAKALQDYQAAHIGRIIEALSDLPEEMQEDFHRLLDRLRSRLGSRHR